MIMDLLSSRTNLDGRGAAISVVLLQSKNSFPTGEYLSLNKAQLF